MLAALVLRSVGFIALGPLKPYSTIGLKQFTCLATGVLGVGHALLSWGSESPSLYSAVPQNTPDRTATRAVTLPFKGYETRTLASGPARAFGALPRARQGAYSWHHLARDSNHRVETAENEASRRQACRMNQCVGGRGRGRTQTGRCAPDLAGCPCCLCCGCAEGPPGAAAPPCRARTRTGVHRTSSPAAVLLF